MKTNVNEQIEGYAEIARENEILRKYSRDIVNTRGETLAAINVYHPKSLDLAVSEVRDETPSTSTMRLVSPDGWLPPFQAGQYVNLFVEVNGIRTSRPYSISSSPAQTGYYDMTVKRVEEGFVSSWLLDSLKPGDAITASSPTGNFYYNPLFHGKNLVFIAGGSGITPFMSMVREVTDRGLDRKIHLVYGNRSENDIIFEEELTDREARHDNFTVDHVISEPDEKYSGPAGFITGKLLKELVKDIDTAMFYVCGPDAMYKFVLRELLSMEIPRRRIRVEVYGPPGHPAGQPGWPEEVSPDQVFQVKLNGKTVPAKAGEPLMNSLERSGIVLPALCRSGECSLCRTKLMKGRVFHPESVKIRKSDLKYNYIHPCVAFPLEDLELMV